MTPRDVTLPSRRLDPAVVQVLKELKPGDRLVFTDMMQYSFVKNNTFNGVPLPDLAVLNEDNTCTVLRAFGYDEFRRRLG